MFPRDDLSMGTGKQEVKLQRNVSHQVLQDGCLLATGKKCDVKTEHWTKTIQTISKTVYSHIWLSTVLLQLLFLNTK